MSDRDITKEWGEYFMRHVYLAASMSKDPRTKIGAVLVRERNIIATGFNGFPIGVSDDEDRYNDKETKYKMVCHAEANAVFISARFGIPTLGATLVTQGVPCAECAKSVIQAGICRIITHKQWPNLTHSEQWVKSIAASQLMLDEAGVQMSTLNQKLKLKGFLDGKEISV